MKALIAILGMLLCGTASAGELWSNGKGSDGTYLWAGTVLNDGTSIVAGLGEYCYRSTKTCQWQLASTIACTMDQKTIPVMINADQGAALNTLTCRGTNDNKTYNYIFNDWRGLEGAMKNSNRISFVVAMANDEFKVYRFSLFGATVAQTQMETDFGGVDRTQNNSHVKAASETL